ncbi:hypothetical protein ACCQ08_26015, partial [Comamonas sp. SY3]|uniref:hypothetical protein n=1 Tax=Comamonas sp. SY3 TaxID=3243601 RepID=UPI00359305C0
LSPRALCRNVNIFAVNPVSQIHILEEYSSLLNKNCSRKVSFVLTQSNCCWWHGAVKPLRISAFHQQR